jgi:hypothetical protein
VWNEFGIDWLNVTALDSRFDPMYEAVMTATGGEAPKVSKGRQRFKVGCYWPTGVELHRDGPGDRCWLQCSGGACRLLGFESVHQMGRECLMGGKCTRLDLRRDVRGEGLTLISDITGGCRDGQLRRALTWRPYAEFTSEGEVQRINHGVGLGSPKGMRYVRAYDKGLESGEAPVGSWVRFEAQLRDAAAHQAAVAVFSESGVQAAAAVGLSFLAGVVDFRVGPRGDGVHVDRLPRPSWWLKFLESIEAARPALPVVDPELERWRRAFCVQYGAVLVEAARRAGVTVADAAEWAAGAAEVTAGTRDNPMVCLIADALRGTVS